MTDARQALIRETLDKLTRYERNRRFPLMSIAPLGAWVKFEDVEQLLADFLVAQTWQTIATAPKDGSAVLGFGLHSGPQPDAQRGVKAGDHWWAIMLWDIWRNPDPAGWGEQSLWVFAKDGKPTWSRPTNWMPLPVPPLAERTPDADV